MVEAWRSVLPSKKCSVAPSITNGTFSVTKQRTSVSMNIALALFLSSCFYLLQPLGAEQ